jgi:hypothetical protein
MAGDTERWALEAGTDQALAIARDNRDAPGSEDITPLAHWMAGILADQFPDSRAFAGRVLMVAAQFVSAAAAEAPEVETAFVGTAMAFAAEQVVREAGQS